MRRALGSIIVALLAAPVMIACSSSLPTPAKPPPADRETRVAPRRPVKEEPPLRIIAPPPAYGNKIVMAERTKTPRL